MKIVWSIKMIFWFSDKITHSIEDYFCIDYFVYILYKLISSIESGFEHISKYKITLVFYLILKNQKLCTIMMNWKQYYINIKNILSFSEYYHIENIDLIIFKNKDTVRNVNKKKFILHWNY